MRPTCTSLTFRRWLRKTAATTCSCSPCRSGTRRARPPRARSRAALLALPDDRQGGVVRERPGEQEANQERGVMSFHSQSPIQLLSRTGSDPSREEQAGSTRPQRTPPMRGDPRRSQKPKRRQGQRWPHPLPRSAAKTDSRTASVTPGLPVVLGTGACPSASRARTGSRARSAQRRS